MEKAKIIKDYEKKIRLFDKYNKHYYEKSSPLITDRKFDSLKQQILLLEKKYPYLKSEKSPSITVGFKPSKNFKKVKHKVPMLSLGNAFNQKDLENFEKKIINFFFEIF